MADDMTFGGYTQSRDNSLVVIFFFNNIIYMI